MRRLLLQLIVFIPLAIAPASAQQREFSASEERKLLAADSLFDLFSRNHGIAAAFLAFMADDATIFPAGQFPISGRDAIAQHFGDFPTEATLRWKPLRAEVAQSGELGYTYGTAEYQSADSSGTRQSSYSKYLTVWKKQADGSWKFILDIGNRNPPPERK